MFRIVWTDPRDISASSSIIWAQVDMQSSLCRLLAESSYMGGPTSTSVISFSAVCDNKEIDDCSLVSSGKDADNGKN